MWYIRTLHKLLLFILINMCYYNITQSLIVGSDTAGSRQASATFPAADGDNEMRGFASFESGFSLENYSTSCVFNSFFPISGSMQLNGGTLNLSKDLLLDEGIQIKTVGTINGNSHTMKIQEESLVTLPSGEPSRTLSFVTQQDTNDVVFSVDWSYDNSYVAISRDDEFSGDELQVYSFNGSTLSLVDEVNLSDPVYSVRWHPSSYLLAAARDSTSGDELYVYELNGSTLTQKDGRSYSTDARAVAWHPTGSYLAVTSDDDNLYIYSVSGSGILTDVTSKDIGSVSFSNNALDWKSTGTYLAVGLKTASGISEFLVYSFDGSTLTLNAQEEFGFNVEEVAWHPTQNYIAVGLGGSSERLRVYEHDSGAGTLTEKTSAYIGESRSVFSVDWNSDGTLLVIGRDAGTGTELRMYDFDSTNVTFSLTSEVDSASDINSVRWSPDDNYVAYGDTADFVRVYAALSTGSKDEFIFNNLKLLFDTDIDLKKSAYFQGDCLVDGKKHSIDLSNGGSIIVDDGATLLLKDVTLKGITSSNIRCDDTVGTFSLQNVTWLQDANFSFTQGKIDIVGDVVISGTHVFIYESDQVSTIAANARLYFDTGMTFSYDPAGGASNLISFADNSSILHLYETTLYVTTAGLDLTKGTLVVEGICPVESDATVQADGINFGDGASASNDINLKVFPESGLKVNSGYVVYKNLS